MVQMELYNMRDPPWREEEKFVREPYSNLSHICNRLQPIYTRTYLLRLCLGQVYLNNSNLLPFDYLLKSILTVILLIKA